MKTDRVGAETGEIRARLAGVVESLRPEVARPRAIAELEDMFRRGAVPDPPPRGFLHGALIATTTWPALDGLSRRIARRWMPWQGKSFDPASSTGVNRFAPDVRAPMRALWPSYRPVSGGEGVVEAFPFLNRVGPGALDPDVEVLKIDYDFDANPGFIIRRILDELVLIDDGLYLGKVLFRWNGTLRRLGFFSLETSRD
jgi:hypothetical protein